MEHGRTNGCHNSKLHTDAVKLRYYTVIADCRINIVFFCLFWHGTCGRCLGENVTLEIVEKAGHVPQMEDPDRFNKVVLDFLLASQKPSSTRHAR